MAKRDRLEEVDERIQELEEAKEDGSYAGFVPDQLEARQEEREELVQQDEEERQVDRRSPGERREDGDDPTGGAKNIVVREDEDAEPQEFGQETVGTGDSFEEAVAEAELQTGQPVNIQRDVDRVEVTQEQEQRFEEDKQQLAEEQQQLEEVDSDAMIPVDQQIAQEIGEAKRTDELPRNVRDQLSQDERVVQAEQLQDLLGEQKTQVGENVDRVQDFREELREREEIQERQEQARELHEQTSNIIPNVERQNLFQENAVTDRPETQMPGEGTQIDQGIQDEFITSDPEIRQGVEENIFAPQTLQTAGRAGEQLTERVRQFDEDTSTNLFDVDPQDPRPRAQNILENLVEDGEELEEPSVRETEIIEPEIIEQTQEDTLISNIAGAAGEASDTFDEMIFTAGDRITDREIEDPQPQGETVQQEFDAETLISDMEREREIEDGERVRLEDIDMAGPIDFEGDSRLGRTIATGQALFNPERNEDFGRAFVDENFGLQDILEREQGSRLEEPPSTVEAALDAPFSLGGLAGTGGSTTLGLRGASQIGGRLSPRLGSSVSGAAAVGTGGFTGLQAGRTTGQFAAGEDAQAAQTALETGALFAGGGLANIRAPRLQTGLRDTASNVRRDLEEISARASRFARGDLGRTTEDFLIMNRRGQQPRTDIEEQLRTTGFRFKEEDLGDGRQAIQLVQQTDAGPVNVQAITRPRTRREVFDERLDELLSPNVLLSGPIPVARMGSSQQTVQRQKTRTEETQDEMDEEFLRMLRGRERARIRSAIPTQTDLEPEPLLGEPGTTGDRTDTETVRPTGIFTDPEEEQEIISPDFQGVEPLEIQEEVTGPDITITEEEITGPDTLQETTQDISQPQDEIIFEDTLIQEIVDPFEQQRQQSQSRTPFRLAPPLFSFDGADDELYLEDQIIPDPDTQSLPSVDALLLGIEETEDETIEEQFTGLETRGLEQLDQLDSDIDNLL